MVVMYGGPPDPGDGDWRLPDLIPYPQGEGTITLPSGAQQRWITPAEKAGLVALLPLIDEAIGKGGMHLTRDQVAAIVWLNTLRQ